jgi:hypothetical protein
MGQGASLYIFILIGKYAGLSYYHDGTEWRPWYFI